jgi:hypothetical protein
VIDADPDAHAIDQVLAELEAEHGNRPPRHPIEVVDQWSRSLAEKGILLDPVSAAYRG